MKSVKQLYDIFLFLVNVFIIIWLGLSEMVDLVSYYSLLLVSLESISELHLRFLQTGSLRLAEMVVNLKLL